MPLVASRGIFVSEMPSLAVIDLGSNSLKVSVMDADSQVELGRRAESVRLFQAGEEGAPLPSGAQDAALAALGRLLDFARGKGAGRIVILGTSALRESRNRQAFADRVRTETGLPLTIVSGEVEARLIAAAVRSDPAFQGHANILGFDLGGGSLEVIELRGARCVLARSFALGSVRLTNGYLRGGLGKVDELDQASIRTHLVGALQGVIPPGAAESHLIVGGGGAFAATALYLEAIGEPPVGGRLPVLRIRELKDHVCDLTMPERLKIPGLPADRADIMPAALITLCTLADMTGAEAFHLTHRGLRHGVVELMLGPSAELL